MQRIQTENAVKHFQDLSKSTTEFIFTTTGKTLHQITHTHTLRILTEVLQNLMHIVIFCTEVNTGKVCETVHLGT